ncbi:hypothetical protein AB0F17_66105, partial [Nonomuraea sp. NPDC026600]|uniref:hypothetical protein n=1 Tax=Nonomuraea sp. NPDC026600 TaxID=3155363 RepID=UPI0033FE6FDB
MMEAPPTPLGVSDFPPLWAPRFPSPEGLDLAARMFDARPAWKGEEGPRPRVVISAGAFAIEAPDLARRERRYERALKARQLDVDVIASYLARGEKVPERVPCREITGWSRKSRANMVRALCELDYRPMLDDPSRLPALVTLTYPGDWRAVAPNGKAVKQHLDALRKRYWRSFGRYAPCPDPGGPGHRDHPEDDVCWHGDDLVAVWKLEFQHRGAPHFHLLMVPPHRLARYPEPRARKSARVGAGLPFKEWLSAVWADIVGADDELVVDDKGRTARQRHREAGTGVDFAEGLKAYDPKRVAVYFTKHGSFAAKEYQNCVPEEWREPGQGPGRFWGYWKLRRRTSAVEVTPEHAVQAARIARRWARAQGTTRQATVTRTPGGRARPDRADIISVAGAQLLAER